MDIRPGFETSYLHCLCQPVVFLVDHVNVAKTEEKGVHQLIRDAHVAHVNG
jgi:hypothetical protein